MVSHLLINCHQTLLQTFWFGIKCIFSAETNKHILLFQKHIQFHIDPMEPLCPFHLRTTAAKCADPADSSSQESSTSESSQESVMEVQTWTSPGKASDQPDHKHDDDVVTENRWEILLVACHVAQIIGLALGIFFLNQKLATRDFGLVKQAGIVICFSFPLYWVMLRYFVRRPLSVSELTPHVVDVL